MDNAPPQTDPAKPGDDLLAGYLTRLEAAAALTVSAKSLDRLHNNGEGPPRTMIAGRIHYRLESLQAWLLAQEGAV